jgi:maltose O-acetyltransferase
MHDGRWPRVSLKCLRSVELFASLIRNRYRPPIGSYLWAKYWAKRFRLGAALATLGWSNRRYARACAAFGSRTIISPSTIAGPLERLTVGADCAIGRVQIQLHAPVRIGNCVVINDGCQLLTGTHDVHSPDWELLTSPIVIEDYAWLATSSIILPGVTIGRGAVVGAGSVVTSSVEPLTIVAGNPARPIGRRQSSEFRYKPSRSYALFEAWLGPAESRFEPTRDIG